MANEVWFLPDGTFTSSSETAAEEWSQLAFRMRDALEQVPTLVENLIKHKPVRNVDELINEIEILLENCPERII